LNIREIYLDLDDVLCAFSPFVFNELVGTDNEISYDWWQPRWGFQIEAAVADTRRLLGKGQLPGDFWLNVTRDIWANVPKTPFCDWLIDAARRAVGFERVFILTRPTRHGDCYGGKADWVISQLGELWVEQLVLTKHKHKLASADRLLIDDSAENIDAFLAAGGNTIMVARPWNPLSREPCPVEYIRHKWTHYFADPMPAFTIPEIETTDGQQGMEEAR